MSNITTDTGIRDNHTRGTVASFLKEKIQDEIQAAIDAVQNLRFE